MYVYAYDGDADLYSWEPVGVCGGDEQFGQPDFGGGFGAEPVSEVVQPENYGYLCDEQDRQECAQNEYE